MTGHPAVDEVRAKDHRRREARAPEMVSLIGAILEDHDCAIDPPARVLDFGCGAGENLIAYRRAGYQAFGCDVVIADGAPRELVREIRAAAYRLPFDDGCFDLVVSAQVLEHVQDYDQAFGEIRRVLRPGGVSLHIFPSRWRVVEGHVLVPLASIVRSRAWLGLWARLGIRNQYQTDLPWRTVAEINREYLTTRTNYLPGRVIREHGLRHFDRVVFAERSFMVNFNGRFAHPLRLAGRHLPGSPSVFGMLHTRCLLLARSPEESGHESVGRADGTTRAGA